MELREYKDPRTILAHELENSDPNFSRVQRVNLQDFIRNMNFVIDIVNPEVEFAPAYPKSIVDFDEQGTASQITQHITWDIKHMLPGVLGGKGSTNVNSGTREVKPRIREEIKHKNGQMYEVYGQLFDTYIQFDLWALTGHEAEELAYWFQLDFMTHYSPLFGNAHVRFWERIRDRELFRINNKLQTRSLIYQVQFEETTVKSLDTIRRIRAKLQTDVK